MHKHAAPDSLLVCGFLWSGSSAVVDLLRSSESIGVLPGEFDEFRRPGMVADHLDGIISEVYPTKLLPELNLLSRLKSTIPFNRRFGDRKKQKYSKVREDLLFELAQKIDHQSASSYEKMKYARDWLVSLKHAFAPKKDFLLIDQPILWGQHLAVWPEFFAPFKMIVVGRNPLDQIAEVIRQNHLFLHFRSPEADIWGGGRSGAFNYILHALLVRIIHYQNVRDIVGSEKLLFVKFEDLVNDPSSVVERIAEFLSMDVSEIYPSRYFDPSSSAKNINIYRQILTEEERCQLSDLLEIYQSSYERRFQVETFFNGSSSHQQLKVLFQS